MVQNYLCARTFFLPSLHVSEMKQIIVWRIQNTSHTFTTKEAAEEYLEKSGIAGELEVVETTIAIYETAMECLEEKGILFLTGY